ncbi:MAG: hypothetical protein K2J62_09065 [Bacteroidales bacterium]|nr:hypothetical protein [Bacteroidales bacterium]
MKAFFKILITTILSLGCSKMTISEENYSYNLPLGSTTLLIYGGKDNDEYLGKLNASKYDSESIWNQYGKYGSRYNSKSIWNQYGTYGSKYNTCSPFNDYASYPPILVDKNGKFYGYFTSNKYKSQRAKLKLVDIICENHEAISEDVSGWYDKIF